MKYLFVICLFGCATAPPVLKTNCAKDKSLYTIQLKDCLDNAAADIDVPLSEVQINFCKHAAEIVSNVCITKYENEY